MTILKHCTTPHSKIILASYPILSTITNPAPVVFVAIFQFHFLSTLLASLKLCQHTHCLKEVNSGGVIVYYGNERSVAHESIWTWTVYIPGNMWMNILKWLVAARWNFAFDELEQFRCGVDNWKHCAYLVAGVHSDVSQGYSSWLLLHYTFPFPIEFSLGLK